MATYYVRPDGNDGNAGTGSATNQAWRTIQKALGATGIGSGDTLYIAPGLYGEQITIGGTYSTTTSITGDPTASQFSGLTAGRVQIGAFTNLGNAPIYTGNTISATSKNNLYFSNIEFLLSCGNNFGNAGVAFSTSVNITFDKCVFQQCNTATHHLLNISPPTSTALNLTVKNCVFSAANSAGGYHIVMNGQSAAGDTTSITNSIFMHGVTSVYSANTICSITNCTFLFMTNRGIEQAGTPALTLRNSLFYLCAVGATFTSSSSGTQTFCRYTACGTAFTGAPTSATSSVVGTPGVDNFYSLLVGGANLQPMSSIFGSPNTAFGTATGAPATDMYGVTWTGATPDAGSATYRNIGSVGTYLPSERNASTITIAPGSTSQSIELYLGATGLTASTAGLSARYNRTRTASVSIPLVARTIAQAWTSGGFAEVDATNMPGVYRIDLPDAALAAGADDVTIVVRGASGTNGAVMTVKLSSGGLTSAQTASAVWGASPAGYVDATTYGGVVNQIDQTVTGTSTLVQDVPYHVWEELTANHDTHGSFGWNVLRADAPSKEGLVTLHQSGGISRIDADVHAIVNDTAAAAELKGALLHTGGDYITADLLNPVASAQTLRIGPFGVRADGGGADGALDLNQSTAANIVVQMTDGQGTGIDQTSATVQAKVYNVAGALVATYTCTAAYALGGFMSIPMTTTVTGTAGSYIINLWSTVGSTVTVYGPLQLRVRAI